MDLSKEFHEAALSFRQGQWKLAIASYQQILLEDPGSLEACMNLASAYGADGQFDKAIDSFRRATYIAPGHPNTHYHLALACLHTHNLGEADEAVQKGLKLFPRHTAMQVLAARVERRNGKLDAAFQRLQPCTKITLSDIDMAAVYTELGNILDKLGDYHAAFESYVTGQAAAGRSPQADQARAIPFLNNVQSSQTWFTAERFEKWINNIDDDQQNAPIFLVGHPRSGTTLSEHILSSHPRLEPSDENPIIRTMVTDLPGGFGSTLPYPDCLDVLTDADIRSLRQHYRSATSELLGIDRQQQRLVDKHPLNLVDLGFVRRIFPEAKILVAIRDPRDVCLSCFFQPFGMNKSTVNFTNLHDSAKHYEAIMGFWLHLREVLDIPYMEFCYEDLTNNFESKAKEMIAYLDEPWDDSILRFYEHSRQRYVSTPSYEGVTSPVYQGSVARWKNYTSQIEQILPVLQPFITAFGYK